MKKIIAHAVDIDQTVANIAQAEAEREALTKSITNAVENLVEKSEPLDDSTFWSLVDRLKDFIKIRHNSYVEGIGSFLHTVVFGHYASKGLETDGFTALSFVRMYEEKVASLYKPLFDVIELGGDDTYNDILDSFPLFGKDRFEKALHGEIIGTSEDQYQGENYIGMRLEEKLVDYFSTFCVYSERDRKLVMGRHD